MEALVQRTAGLMAVSALSLSACASEMYPFRTWLRCLRFGPIKVVGTLRVVIHDYMMVCWIISS